MIRRFLLSERSNIIDIPVLCRPLNFHFLQFLHFQNEFHGFFFASLRHRMLMLNDMNMHGKHLIASCHLTARLQLPKSFQNF